MKIIVTSSFKSLKKYHDDLFVTMPAYSSEDWFCKSSKKKNDRQALKPVWVWIQPKQQKYKKIKNVSNARVDKISIKSKPQIHSF